MIRIQKLKEPAILSKRGRQQTRELKQVYDGGERDFGEFDKTIYGAKSVKDALRKAQHGKCAFCESRVDHISYGDVEHYRPKAGFVQAEGEELQKPGYYWLAYDWDNLFFCCQLCNQRFKRNLFPLRRPLRRALSHHDDLAKEEPLLLHPSSSDPFLHITFLGDEARPFGGSAEGQATIDIMGLNRPELREVRLDHLITLMALRSAREAFLEIQATGPLPADLQARLRELETIIELKQEPQAIYSAMARAVFA